MKKKQFSLKAPYLYILTTLSIAAFYIATLYDGHNWSGDFGQYIHHAKNLAEGKNYLDTGYLVNFISYFNGPYAYPPIYPLLLTPIYWVFGLDLEAMKWIGVLCFCSGLFVCTYLFNKFLTQKQLLLLLLIIGFNPYLWYFRNSIASDYPFFLICAISLYLISQIESHEKLRGKNPLKYLFYSSLTGTLLYAAYGCREIGIVLPLTLLAYDLTSNRRISLTSIISITIFILLVFLQKHFLSESLTPEHIQDNLKSLSKLPTHPIEISHAHWINLDPQRILERALGYRWALQNFWPDTQIIFLNQLKQFLFNVSIIFSAIGYFSCIIKRISPLEIFFAGYISILLLFGAPATIRYLIPVFPFFIFYVLIGFNIITKQKKASQIKHLSWFFYGIITLVTVFSFREASHKKIELGITHPEATQMFQFLIENTKEEDTIVFRKPRILALITARNSAAYPNFSAHNLPNDIDSFFNAIEADYYVDMNLDDFMHPIISTKPPSKNFVKTFKNDYFVVYKYIPQQKTYQKAME